MAKLKHRTGAIAEDFRDLGDIFHALGEVTERERRSNRRHRALLTAIKALSFACDQQRILDFHRFLRNWPGELTSVEERYLAELGVEDRRARSRQPKQKRSRKRGAADE